MWSRQVWWMFWAIWMVTLSFAFFFFVLFQISLKEERKTVSKPIFNHSFSNLYFLNVNSQQFSWRPPWSLPAGTCWFLPTRRAADDFAIALLGHFREVKHCVPISHLLLQQLISLISLYTKSGKGQQCSNEQGSECETGWGRERRGRPCDNARSRNCGLLQFTWQTECPVFTPSWLIWLAVGTHDFKSTPPPLLN